MVEIKDRTGKVISSSKNLRGLIAHAGKITVEEVDIREYNAGEGQLYVCFVNNDYCVTDFASFSVLKDWIQSRRGLQDAFFYVNGDYKGTLDKNNVYFTVK